MQNKSGVLPVGHRVLIYPEQVEDKTASGIIVSTAAQNERETLAQMYGVVIAMGNTCYADQPSPWCKVGDRVSFAKYSGLIYKGLDEKNYRVISDLDVVALVKEGVK